jgi:hypothetical protein
MVSGLSKIGERWRLGLRCLCVALVCLPSTILSAKEPLAAVRLAGLNRLLADIDALGEESGFPEFPRLARSVLQIAGDLKGIDRDRPWLVELALPEEGQRDPGLRLSLPVSSEADLRVTLDRLGFEFAEVAGGPLRLRRRGESGERAPSARFDGDWLRLSNRAESLDFPDWAWLQSPLTADADLHIDLQRLPPGLLENLIQQLREEGRRDRRRREGEREAEHQFRQRASLLLEDAVIAVFHELESVDVQLNIAPDNPDGQPLGLQVQAAMRTRAGGSVAAALEQLPVEQRSLQAIEEAALTLATALNLPGEVRNLLQEGVELIRQTNEGALLNAPPRYQRAVSGLLNSLSQTFAAGHLEGLLAFEGVDERMVLVAGGCLASGGEWAHALELLLPEAEKSDDVDEVQLGVSEINRIVFHALTTRRARAADEMLYGPRPKLFVGAGEDQLWVAVGGDGALQILPEYAGGAAEAVREPRELLLLELHLLPWLPLLERNGRIGGTATRVRELFGDSRADQLRLTVSTRPAELHAQLTLDRTYLKLLAAIIKERARLF